MLLLTGSRFTLFTLGNVSKRLLYKMDELFKLFSVNAELLILSLDLSEKNLRREERLSHNSAAPRKFAPLDVRSKTRRAVFDIHGSCRT